MSDVSRTVCVYCASSDGKDPEHLRVARRLGELLAEQKYSLVYGGSRMGAMGAVADGALSRGGHVTGVMPDFLRRLELAHNALSELHLVDDMRTRKHRMLTSSCAVIALPGGCGTFEELLEAITLRKLGVHRHPILIVNTAGFYAPLLELFDSARQSGFLAGDEDLWTVVPTAEAAVAQLTRLIP